MLGQVQYPLSVAPFEIALFEIALLKVSQFAKTTAGEKGQYRNPDFGGVRWQRRGLEQLVELVDAERKPDLGLVLDVGYRDLFREGIGNAIATGRPKKEGFV